MGRLKAGLRQVATWISAIRLVPHVLALAVTAARPVIRADLQRWVEAYSLGSSAAFGLYRNFLFVMTWMPEFRNLFYLRLGWRSALLRPLCRPLSTLHISTSDIGPGLFIQHGEGTWIGAARIGSHCWINQQVAIGFVNNAVDCPTIGDNVTLSAGAKVLGRVRVGDNSQVGANSVVLRDVPPDVTVIGVPAVVVWRRQRVAAQPA